MKKLLLLLAVPALILTSCADQNGNGNSNVTFNNTGYSFKTIYSQGWSSSTGVDTNKIIYGCTIRENVSATYPSLEVEYGSNLFLMGDPENFQAFMTGGIKPFQTSLFYSQGVNIIFQQSSGSDRYISNLGSQTGSSAEFTSMTFVNASDDYTNCTLNFTCKLYNENNVSDVKNISGTVDARFVEYF